jgi:hypothetical protein
VISLLQHPSSMVSIKEPRCSPHGSTSVGSSQWANPPHSPISQVNHHLKRQLGFFHCRHHPNHVNEIWETSSLVGTLTAPRNQNLKTSCFLTPVKRISSFRVYLPHPALVESRRPLHSVMGTSGAGRSTVGTYRWAIFLARSLR